MSADIVQIRDYKPKTIISPSMDAAALVIILPVVRIERFDERPPSFVLERRRRRNPSLLTLKQKMEALRKLQAAERGD